MFVSVGPLEGTFGLRVTLLEVDGPHDDLLPRPLTCSGAMFRHAASNLPESSTSAIHNPSR